MTKELNQYQAATMVANICHTAMTNVLYSVYGGELEAREVTIKNEKGPDICVRIEPRVVEEEIPPEVPVKLDTDE